MTKLTTPGNSRFLPSNKLPSALLPSDPCRLPTLELVEFKQGDVIHRPFETYKYIYFPETCCISLVSTFEDGSTVEAGIIGSEGFAGIAAVFSDGVSPREAIVQTAGTAFRMRSAAFKAIFDESRPLRDKTLGFVYAFYSQVSQNGSCNKLHHVEGRLAKWLLMTHDRTRGDELALTHEFIGQMLGIQRPTLSLMAAYFRSEGLLEYSRGKIVVLDRKGLEAKSCECYETISESYSRYQTI